MIYKKELEEKYNELLKENGKLKEEVARCNDNFTERVQWDGRQYNELKEKYDTLYNSIVSLFEPIVKDIVKNNLSISNIFKNSEMTSSLMWDNETFDEHHSDVEVYEPCGLDE